MSATARATPEDARACAGNGRRRHHVGRAAQGRPWLFREIACYLETGRRIAPPSLNEMHGVLLEQLEGIYQLYGEEQGARVARKHIGWTVRDLPGAEDFRRSVVRIDAAPAQHSAVNDYFARLAA